MRIQFEEVPLDVRRRAARAVAALVGDRLSPTGLRKAEPRFGEAAPVYRPDLADIAYWEIEIAGLTTVLPTREGKAGRADRGFIVVATGGHDVPVPHFSLDTAPPSRQLEQLGAIDRVVKLDALCYAGLDDRGDLVGHIGTMPPKLTGMPDALPKRLPAGYATTVPAGAHDGEDGDKTEPQRVRTSRGKSVVELQEWRSWNEITTEYADCYRHQLAALAQRAQPRWETEKLTEEFGEGIHSGATHTVWLLEEGDFTIEGPGADLVAAELNPQPLPPKLVLRPRADVSAKDTSFEVHLRYAGSEERLRYFIVPDQAPTTTVNRIGPLGEEL
ncbi:MAG TPA: hypothetical protein PLG46_01125 [Ornithinibacter sp.]|jgi:hypothetical protein|nr:hypothetical protein [Ornithinibacter sp.]